VDGVPADVHRVNVAFRGVLVPDGAHLVRLEFAPLILPVSLAITLLTAIGLAVMVWAGSAAARKTGTAASPERGEGLGT
jgi:hypothetical protein